MGANESIDAMEEFTPRICDMPADEYHADPCPTPSLSAGMINNILVAPAVCKERSRRLNPDYEEEEGAERFSIGTVSHVMHLEPHLFKEKVAVIAAADWRTKAAQEARRAAAAESKTAILEKHMARILRARDALQSNTAARDAFSGGKAEQAMFWRHPKYGFWCRARPDYMAPGYLADYKATGNADPMRFDKHAVDMGYYRRSAWYLDGAATLLGKEPDHYWFVNQETKAPYLVSVCEIDQDGLEAGRQENARACELFARCLKSGDWFGYRHRSAQDQDLTFTISLPNWKLMQIDRGE